MAVLTKLHIVTDFIKENPKCIYYKILDTDQKSVISSNSIDITPELAISRIEQTLESLSGDYCYITLSEQGDTSKGMGGVVRNKLSAKVELANKIILPHGGKINNSSQPDIFALFLMQMAESKKLELEVMQLKLKEQYDSSSKGSPMETIAEKILTDEKLKGSLLNFVEALTGKLINSGQNGTLAKPSVSGVKKASVSVDQSLNDLNKLYPKMSELLPLIKEYEEKNKGSIENLHNMITGQLNKQNKEQNNE